MFSYVISELYFFSSKGVDFPDYFRYIEYFLYEDIKPSNNHGLLFYYSNLITILLRSESLNSVNEIVFLNSTIQVTNFIFYIIGTIGLYRLLKEFNYKKESIYVSLSIMHMIPKVIEMRVLLKPEILVFCFLPWIILGINNYFNLNDKKSLILSLFPLSLLITSKGSIAGMVIIFLFINYISKVSKKNIKELIIFFLLFIIFCIGVGFENYSINELSFFEVSTTSNYDNIASIDFLYKINFWDLYFSPVLGSHNDSFIGITLLDTFGDYFAVNLKSKDNYFTYYEINPFENFSRYHLELILALVFYSSIFASVKKDKKINIFLLSPLIGIGILLLNSFGFPDKNFDPTKGDTLKVSYYAFFLAISFVFLICDLLKNNEKYLKILSTLLLICLLFLLGFPKESYQEINENLDTKVQISLLCRPLSFFVSNTSPSDCGDIVVKSCEYNLYSNAAQNTEEEEVPDGFTRVYREDTILGEIVPNEQLSNFIEEGGYSLTPVLGKNELKYINETETLLLKKGDLLVKTSSVNDCKQLISQGYRPSNNISYDSRKLPITNTLYGIASLFFVYYTNKKSKENLSLED
tara:strand:+ start:156 stop:1895 length:1740 start_codon:yes stop_codon:yes gene_type:complete